MKDSMLIKILLYLSRKKNVKAFNIANHFNISTRSVYRYIDTLSLLGVPVCTKIGRTGGIELLGDFYLDKLMLSPNEIEIIKKNINNVQDEKLKRVLQKLI